MKARKLFALCFGIWMLCCSWGFYAHRIINKSAIFTLPAPLSGFYKMHIHHITEKAIDADKRCYVDSAESPRHYIDIDRYSEESGGTIPVHWSNAKEKYGERKLMARGVVPWQIYLTYQKLVQAFYDKHFERIIKYAADLGHYVADAHVPLHTTANYNGQYTDQIGIHAFWESRLPEMFGETYNLHVGKAAYISDPLEMAWQIVRESNTYVDSVLLIEKELSQTFPKHQQKGYINRKNILTYTYSDPYATAYHDNMNGMVEARMRQSIQRLGSYWFSAWVAAGQPTLAPLKKVNLEDSPTLKQHQIIGREEWH